jgi:hypothetical protein
VKPISLRSNDTKEVELALNRLIRELDRSGNGSTLPSNIDYAPGPSTTKGEKGDQGLQGEKGDKGETSFGGPAGIQGPTGPTGATGPVGPAGPQGDQGIQGEDGPASTFVDTFETVSANLAAYNPTYAYSGGDLSTVTYDLGGGNEIVKTFSYSGGNLSTIVLSGDTPAGIDLTKTFTFDGSGNLTSIAYS